MSDIVHISSITQIHDFFGYPKPKHPLVSVLPITDDMVSMDYGDVTYVLDVYQISLKVGIVGSLVYGRNSYDFQEGSMLFTKPGQVLRIEDNEALSGSSGWTLIFHPDLIRKGSLGQQIEGYTFFDYDVTESLHVSEDEKQSLTELVQKIEKEINQNIDRHSQKLIVSNIELLLDYCTRYFDRQFFTRTHVQQDVLTRFERLLKDYFHSDQPLETGIPSASWCGESMGMSPNYLSDLLKKETGKSTREHVHHQLVEKAKSDMLGTTQSISEIAYGLGFEYPGHFTKVFKKQTGMSPAAFRSQN